MAEPTAHVGRGPTVTIPVIADGDDDLTLVAGARSGDRVALDSLLRRHHNRIYAICRRITGNDADAADASQEALIAIVRRLDRFDGRSSFSTWSYRVATNACLDELRRRSRRPVPIDQVPELSIDESAGRVTDRMLIDEALATLSHDFRAAVALRDLCGLDYAEIAEILHVPVGTVKSRIARARSALADLLAPPRTGEPHRPDRASNP